jgi:rhodanese-related sulfurtransferase
VWGRKFLRDLLMIPLLLAGCLALGLVVNQSRESSLPLVYSSPEARLNSAVTIIGAKPLLDASFGADVDKNEMRRISADNSALILDARPKTFFELGHIPSAISLPRDDFEKSYQSLQKILSSYWTKPIVVYCSDSGCPDSRLVGEALHKLGYRDVRLFRGGWDAWIDANLPTRQGCDCGD